MRSSRSDPRFEKAASILRLRDYAFLSFLLFALLVVAATFWQLKFLAIPAAIAWFAGAFYFVLFLFSKCPFCGDRWNFPANLRESFNPLFVFKRPSIAGSRCINCGASDKPAKW
jgi:hypothetical protein